MTTAVTTIAANAGNHIFAANDTADRCNRLTASRLVRFDTGSSRLAVFANHTAAIANGMTEIRSCDASASTTGVNRTAVVSRLSTIVVRLPRTTIRAKSPHVRPHHSFAARVAATSNTCAASASSATTVIATRNSRIGPTRFVVATASCQGSAVVATQIAPATAAISHAGANRDHAAT